MEKEREKENVERRRRWIKRERKKERNRVDGKKR